MPQAHSQDGDSYFAPVEREDADLDAAMDDEDIPIGRSGNGIVRIGLFGGKQTTSDPDAIQYPEDGGRGIEFIRAVSRAAQDIDDFPGQIRFPREVEDAIYSSSSLTDPFGAYRFTLYLGEMDHRGHAPVMDGLVDYFETEHEGRYDIRAVEFDFDHVTPLEKFRAIFPWAKRENELKANDDLDDYELPRPARSLVSDLRQTPLECREYQPLTVTVHYYNPRSDRDGKYDREFQMDDFYGADEQRFIQKDRRTPVGKALDDATTSTRNTSVSYELSLTVDRETIDALIDADDEPRVTAPDDVARRLGREQHTRDYPQSESVSVGVVSREESDDEMSFTLAVQSVQRR